MSARVKKHAKVAHFVASYDKRHSNAFVKDTGPDLINWFSEIHHNIPQGNVKLTGHQKTKLKKYKSHLRRLVEKSASAETTKQIIQTQGFLPMLLGSLVKLLVKPLINGF